MLWFIEFNTAPHTSLVDGYVFHSPGWYHAPLVIYEKWDGRGELPLVASYVNGFPTKEEAQRIARRVHPDIKIRIVQK